MATQAGSIVDMPAEADFHKSGIDSGTMTGAAIFPSEGMNGGQRPTRIWFPIMAEPHSEQPHSGDRRKDNHEKGAHRAPSSPPLEVVKVVALSQALRCAFASGHWFESVPQSYHCMHRSHEQKRERQGHVDQQPSMQHAVHAHLMVELPFLFADAFEVRNNRMNDLG